MKVDDLPRRSSRRGDEGQCEQNPEENTQTMHVSGVRGTQGTIPANGTLMRNMRRLALSLAAAAAIALPLGAAAATTPKPQPTLPKPKLPTTAEHSEFVVEVNAKGQVVRVKSAKGTGAKDPIFNAQTYGNVLQMWIRHPDGTADVGLYKVTYDFDPKTKKIKRQQWLVSKGGDWANEPGAATVMMQTAEREAKEAAMKQQLQHESQDKSLPPLDTFVAPTASPTARP